MKLSFKDFSKIKNKITVLKDNTQLITVALSSVAQLFLAVLSYLQSLPAIFWKNAYFVIAFGWLSSAAALLIPFKRQTFVLDRFGSPIVQPRFSNKTKVVLLGLSTASAILALSVFIYEKNRKTDVPINPPPFDVPVGKSNSIILDSLLSQRTVTSKLENTSYERANYIDNYPKVTLSLVEGRSSLVASVTSGGINIAPIKRIVDRIANGVDNQTPQELQDRKDILKWLKDRATSKKEYSYIPKLNDDNDALIKLTRERPDIINALMPSPVEFKTLERLEQEVLIKWVTRYIGSWNPRLRVNVDNTGGTKAFNVSKVKYKVTYVDFIKRTNFSSQLSSVVLDTFFFKIVPEIGEQIITLDSQSSGTNLVKAQDAGKFDLVFCPSPEYSDRIHRINCKGEVYLVTSIGELSAGNLNIDTYNCWVGLAAKYK